MTAVFHHLPSALLTVPQVKGIEPDVTALDDSHADTGTGTVQAPTVRGFAIRPAPEAPRTAHPTVDWRTST